MPRRQSRQFQIVVERAAADQLASPEQQPSAIEDSSSEQPQETVKHCTCTVWPQALIDQEPQWIACESDLPNCPGNGWFHNVCVGLPNEDQSALIERFICKDCQSHSSLAVALPETPCPTPSPVEEEDQPMTVDDDEDDEFVVESIVDHGDDVSEPGTFVFRCRWEGYASDEDSWINEKHLQACYGLVNRYRLAHGLGRSRVLKAMGGAVQRPDIHFNLSNWVTIETVIKELNVHRSTTTYAANLPIEPLDLGLETFPSCPDQDTLFVLLHESHFIPAVYLCATDNIVACESQNVYYDDPAKISQLQSVLGKNVIVLRCGMSFRADHCGAGAVAISLELLRLHRTASFDVAVVLPPKITTCNLVKKLHPEPSQPTQGAVSVSERIIRFTCRKCNAYTKTKKQAVLSHERLCNK